MIEDDHGGAVAGAPGRTCAAAATERWAVARSVSKALGPDLRLASWPATRRPWRASKAAMSLGIRWVSHLLQRTVAALLARPRQ